MDGVMTNAHPGMHLSFDSRWFWFAGNKPRSVFEYLIIVSLETTTASPVSFASNNITYSFDLPSKAYGGNLCLMIYGKYVIFSGDVNQDGTIDISDMTPVDNDAS